MKSSFVLYSVAILGSAIALSSCETVIDASIASAPVQLSVDAWLTDQPGEQQIRLKQTTNYFNNATPAPALSASVTVGDNAGRLFNFTDPDNDGVYTWKPASARDTTRIGVIGRTYGLGIQYKGESYVAFSQMPRVPVIDSLTFSKEKISPVSKEEGYRAQFYATDLPGAIDYYYMRFYRNGKLQNRPQDIILAYDGAFRGSANTDGLVFIRPIRRSINPEKLYTLNDSVRVELRSITADGYLFWELVKAQLQNTGLFATPPANVPSNIRNQKTGGQAAVGYFLVSPVRTRTTSVSAENLRSSGS